MSHHKNTFQANNLVVDYISFKFQSSNQYTKTEIANYLFKLGFNSYQESSKLVQPIKQPILENTNNSFEVCFVLDSPYWEGILLHFSGSNAGRFYFLSTQKVIDWTIFSSAILSRFDLYYSRQTTPTDKISTSDFLTNSYTKLKQTTKTIKLEKNSKGMILKIGNRRSNNCSRIYQRQNSLRFELEIKGKPLQNYHNLLVQNSFEEFEQNMSSHFIIYFGKILPLEYSYTDWLVKKLRPIRQQRILPLALNSDYIQSEIKTDPNKLMMLITFISYAQDLDYDIKDWEGINYRVVTFQLQDFLRFQNQTNYNNYQLTKTKRFFDELQKGILIQSFSDRYFQSLVAIPRVEFEKINKFIIGKVWVVEKLFYYDYPFCFPNLFYEKLSKDQFNVRFELFKTYNSIEIEKTILVNQFLENYPSALNNSQKTKIKQSFIELVQILKENNLIEANYKIIRNGQFYSTDKLTIQNISEGFVIYEKLLI